MNRTSLIIEVLGVAGVLVGLIFIAMELRQNSDATRSQTRADIAIAWAELIDSQRSDDVLLEATLKMQSGEPLTEVERLKIALNTAAHLRLAENSYYQYSQGNHSESEYAAEGRFWEFYFEEPMRRDYWNATKSHFSDGFQEQMQKYMRE